MVAWIKPLELRTIFVSLFAGDATYFTAIALFLIISTAAYFRMTMLAMGFIVVVFLLMFSGYIPPTLLIFISIFLALFVAYIVTKIVKN